MKATSDASDFSNDSISTHEVWPDDSIVGKPVGSFTLAVRQHF